MTTENRFSRLLARFLRGKQVSQKLSTDVIWNICSFGIMGIIGLLLNILIASKYNATVLGVFNQVYAIYILLSQFAVGGVHLSVLKNISQFYHDSALTAEIFTAGLCLTMVLAGLVTFMGYLGRDLFGMILGSKAVSEGILYVLPGLFLFALNKVVLSLINGCRYMRAFAIFQGLRFVFMLTFLLVLIALATEGNKLPAIFSLSEALLLLLLLPYSLRLCRFSFSAKVLGWIKTHFVFGLKAAGGNILLDINTRVDVLALGYFASDKVVGIYSFAAMLAEGFGQLTVVLRVNFNPVITQTLYNRGKTALEEAVRHGRRLSYGFLVPIGLASILVYPLVLLLLNLGSDFSQSWGVFAILMSGILLSAGYLPFQMILNQTGHPGYQTVLVAMFFLTNVILNLCLIPLLGMYGAALGTASAFVCLVVYLKILTYKAVGIRP